MDNGLNYGIPKYRKVIEAGLLAVGLALFIALGARGVQKIGDTNVIAGQQNKRYAVGQENYIYHLPFADDFDSAPPLNPLPSAEANRKDNDDKAQARGAAEATPAQPSEKSANEAIQLAKRELQSKPNSNVN
jgi:hypothetical protein